MQKSNEKNNAKKVSSHNEMVKQNFFFTYTPNTHIQFNLLRKNLEFSKLKPLQHVSILLYQNENFGEFD